jgi:FKBP-type peptidyl-prolyl cis-trans isomerase
MKVDGYRKVRVSPHLAYRDKGIPDLAPPDAVLICQIWLRNSTGSASVESLPGVT